MPTVHLFILTFHPSAAIASSSAKLVFRSGSDTAAYNNLVSGASNGAVNTGIMNNLSQFASNNMVLALNVTAKSSTAVLHVFTGNRANSVAANNSFVQPFGACGLTDAAVVAPVGAPLILPAAAERQVAEPLGDRVAKPE